MEDGMVTIDLIGVAAVITALTSPIVLVVVAFINKKVNSIDHAVNDKLPGMLTIGEEVSELHGRNQDNVTP